MTTMTSRRHFLMAGVGAAVAVSSARLLRGQAAAAGLSANNTLNVACIGVGGRGHGDMMGIAGCDGVNIVALADVDSKMLAKAMKDLHAAATRASRPEPKIKTFADYRQMYDALGKDIDAVVIATPDHSHAPAAIRAMAMGKHVYVEKPLTYTVKEARALTRAARQHKLATQMGNQHHSSEGAHQTVEFITAGAIGPVREVHCWTDRPRNWWPQGVDWPKDTPEVPENLNWDLWLGPSTSNRPYNPIYAPFKWRGWKEWGTGDLGDMACHIMDTANWALDLSRPQSVDPTIWGQTEASYPLGSTIKYTFGPRGDKPACTLTWYDGATKDGKPNLPTVAGDYKLPNNGTLWVGEKGIAVSDYTKEPHMIDAALDKEIKRPEKTLPRGNGHYKDFADACRGGKPAGSNFDYAGPLTEMVNLGVVAVKAGKRIEWDADKMEITNDRAANRFLTREYRKGFEVEGA